MTTLTAKLDALANGSRRHAALASEMYTLEQRLRSAWWRLDDGWQSYAREDVETRCAHALNEAGRQSALQRRLSDAIAAGERRLGAADDDAAAPFGARSNSRNAPSHPPSREGPAPFEGVTGVFLPDAPGVSDAFDALDGEFVSGVDAGLLPSVKVSTEETSVYESCARESCTAVTVQGSGGAALAGASGMLTFKLGSNMPNGFELSLGTFAGASMGKLTASLRGAEISTPSGGVLLQRTLANGAILKVTSETVTAAARSYTDRFGAAHVATATGVKYVVTLSTLQGLLTFNDSVTVREYVWNEKRPAGRARPAPVPIPVPTPEPGDLPWPDLHDWLERRRDDRDAPKIPLIPIAPWPMG